MTGTSIDALDIALVRITSSGYDIEARLINAETFSLASLVSPLRMLVQGRPMSAREMTITSKSLGQLHADAIQSLLVASRESVHLVAAHGQTVFHEPPHSWQLLNPAPIVRSIGVPVVFDLRQADLAAGGEGAPITPIADWILFRRAEPPVAIVNLGGFCNVTFIESRSKTPDRVKGADVCACNQLLDGITRERFGLPMDDGGRLSQSGVVREPLLDSLLDLIQMQQRAGRSLGTGDELADWIRANSDHKAEDLLTTACEAIAKAIAVSCGGAKRLLLAGGGCKNPALRSAIQKHCRAAVELTDDYGVPATFREAMAMAVLGALCQDGIQITLPQITGREDSVALAGAWMFPENVG